MVMTRLIRALQAALVAIAIPVAASADIGVHVRGYGGVANEESNALGPLPGEAEAGGLLGAEAGVSFLFLQAYASYDGFLDVGSLTRVILGVAADVKLGKFRLGGRAGAGLLYEHGDVFGGDGESIGGTGRVGLSLDYGFGKGFYLGLAVDAETFALDGQEGSMDIALGDEAMLTGVLRMTWKFGF